jgi:hypothetical protein
MAFDREHLQLTFKFQDITSSEIGLTGCRLTPAALSFNSVASLASIGAGQLSSIGNALATQLQTAPFYWAIWSQLLEVKAAAVDTAGHYLGAPKIETVAGLPHGTVQNVNPQLTVVAGLRSGITFGRANYGKMYLPHTKLPLAVSQSTASPADASSAAGLMSAFIIGLNGVAGGWVGSPEVSIMSSLGAGLRKRCNFVAVGTVTDTQRRRYDRLVTVRTSDPV